MNSTKSLVLLVDGVPTPNGGGTSQTLANLLSGWKNEIYYLGGDTESQGGFEQRMDVRMLQYTKLKWERLSNRLGHWLNAWLLRRQLNHLQQMDLLTSELPLPEQCIVLLSTSLPEKLIIGRRLQQQGYTVVPYFMDDWMAGSTLRWRGGNLQQTVQQLLQQAPAWLMISRQLELTLRQRYQLAPKPCLVVHNPSPAIEFAAKSFQSAASGVAEDDHSSQRPTANRQLIYAGSIWPMHADALMAVAKAIHLLQAKGQTAYQLTIYTSEAHWARYWLQLTGPGVQYGGWKPYHEIHAPLQQAWLLVCTASFAEAHQAYSRSSVQTKLTDYMACGKPILFVGPADAASGAFVEEYDLGFTLATQLPADIAERLLAITRMPEQYHRKQLNTLHEARTRFSKAVVQQKLYDFLKKIHTPAAESLARH
jgi:glycosyltransferase involved in cell wall biosynthesis